MPDFEFSTMGQHLPPLFGKGLEAYRVPPLFEQQPKIRHACWYVLKDLLEFRCHLIFAHRLLFFLIEPVQPDLNAFVSQGWSLKQCDRLAAEAVSDYNLLHPDAPLRIFPVCPGTLLAAANIKHLVVCVVPQDLVERPAAVAEWVPYAHPRCLSEMLNIPVEKFVHLDKTSDIEKEIGVITSNTIQYMRAPHSELYCRWRFNKHDPLLKPEQPLHILVEVMPRAVPTTFTPYELGNIFKLACKHLGLRPFMASKYWITNHYSTHPQTENLVVFPRVTDDYVLCRGIALPPAHLFR